jgi:hypothetical protein
MSSIAFESSFTKSVSRSRDTLLIALYAVVALGILVELHSLSGQGEEDASGIPFASAMI